MKQLAVLTVVYKNYDVLNDFFATLKSQSDSIHVYVADLTEQPQEYPYPDYATVFHSENKGYAHGVNVALVHALRDNHAFFLVVNSDIIFNSTAISSTIQALSKNKKTVIGGKIYYAPGYEYHKDRYTKNQLGKVLWYAGGTIDWDHVITLHVGVDQVDAAEFNKACPTQFITGCLMAFDTSVVDEVGFWDERYFLYYEDSDFCVRAAQAGIPLRYEPSIQIWHKNAQSTGGAGSRLHERYQNQNRLTFGLKYAPWRTKLHLLKNFVLDSIGMRGR